MKKKHIIIGISIIAFVIISIFLVNLIYNLILFRDRYADGILREKSIENIEIYDKELNLIAEKYGLEYKRDEAYEERTEKSTNSRFIIKTSSGEIVIYIEGGGYYDENDKGIETYRLFFDRPINSKFDTGNNLEDIEIFTELYNCITANKIETSDIIKVVTKDKTHSTKDKGNLFGTILAGIDKNYSFIYGDVTSLRFWNDADVRYAVCSDRDKNYHEFIYISGRTKGNYQDLK